MQSVDRADGRDGVELFRFRLCPEARLVVSAGPLRLIRFVLDPIQNWIVEAHLIIEQFLI